MSEAELPIHLSKEKRFCLQENITNLAEKIGAASSKVLLYLHHNYLQFFNQIEDVANATHYLCTADVMSDLYAYKESLEECALLTSMYGFMHSNTEVIQVIRIKIHFLVKCKFNIYLPIL